MKTLRGKVHFWLKDLIIFIMTCLPTEVKWNIWTFVNGEPSNNWVRVCHELKLKMFSRSFDMEEACQSCDVVRWSKDMLSVKHVEFNTKIFYCSTECLRRHYRRPINTKSLLFAI